MECPHNSHKHTVRVCVHSLALRHDDDEHVRACYETGGRAWPKERDFAQQ